MDAGEGFFMTLPSDGSYETFPKNTLAQYKTLLPQTINLTDGEWEVGFTEVMYGNSVENVSSYEAYVDVLYERKYKNLLENPDRSRIGRYSIEQIAGLELQNLMPLTRWDDSFYDRNNLKKEGHKTVPNPDLKLEIIRIRFKAGDFDRLDQLLNEINLGIKLTFQTVWLACIPEVIRAFPNLAKDGWSPSTDEASNEHLTEEQKRAAQRKKEEDDKKKSRARK